ncbi:MAG: type II secretion system F family protein [Candidatus Micrarchaeia archaeon]|jgi:hypothetical protein
MIEEFYLKVSSIYPRSTLASVRKLLLQSGVQGISPRFYLGFATIATISLGAAVFAAGVFISGDPLMRLAIPIGAMAASAAAFYLWLSMAAASRAKKIETVLPDGLQLISANMRAGMTLENAIWSSAVPEFGPLRDEIRKVSADTFGGKPIDEALAAMGTRVRSRIVERTIRLVAEGIRLGGEMAPLLDEVSADIKSTQTLQKEIATSTTMYAMFILFAAVFAAPALFSISTFYSEMNEGLVAKQTAGLSGRQMPTGGGVPAFGFSSPDAQSADRITAKDIRDFSIAALVITTFFAGLLLGQIQAGHWTEGIKYSPIFVGVALAIYFAGVSVLASTVGKIAG